MTADDHVCVQVTDDTGRVVAHARVSSDLGEEGQQALVQLVTAALRYRAERDAADPEAAAERARRWEAGQQRIRELNRRARGETP